eukprot:PhF_6_TR33831/c0_g1_i2/m.49613/K07573/CSL4, EXOSC1; exosome complex component CSL4
MLVFPGTVIGASTEHIPGHGTIVTGSEIRSTLVGQVHKDPSGQIRVIPKHPGPVLPAQGSVILGNVTRVTTTTVAVEITHVDGRECPYALYGSIRNEEARSDPSVPLHDSFRPGDIVCAEILSLGDARQYVLS